MYLVNKSYLFFNVSNESKTKRKSAISCSLFNPIRLYISLNTASVSSFKLRF